MSENDILVEVKNLKKHFKLSSGFLKTKYLKAVDGVDFYIKKGETLGLVGESGCGKSTVGRTLLYMYEPTDGEIFFKGNNIKTKSEIKAYKSRTSIVFQDPYSSLNPRMTVLDLIGEPLDIQKKYKNKSQRNDRIFELMHLVDLNPKYANRYAHEFSGGQRQRIGIARSLALNPELIVCDEPVSALDVSIQAQVINMFQDLQKKLGLAYLFIAHDLLIVRHISQRIAVMYLGKIVETAKSDELYQNPMHPYTKALISAVPVPDPRFAKTNKRIILSGDIPSPVNKPNGCSFHTRCPYAIDICYKIIPELREILKGHFAACHRAEEINLKKGFYE